MKFMLLVKHQEHEVAQLPPPEVQRVIDEHVTFTEALQKAGVLVVAPRGFRLKPGNEMVRLQAKGPERAVFDGPHPETKEVVGSFYLIDCADKAAAVAWARRHPLWDSDTLEVREVWDC